MKSFRKNYIFPYCIAFVIMLVLSVRQASAETYQYDPAGRLISVTYDDGSSIAYTYDNAGNIIQQQQVADEDGDGVSDSDDLCPGTPLGETVDATGCSATQLDDDNDGVNNALDQCSNTPAGEAVDATGCSATQLDDDNDGINNALDQCPNTPAGEAVDAVGCSASQLDRDNDGVSDADDLCPGTPPGETVDANGCSATQLDDDNDGVNNALDQCPGTTAGEIVDANGCSTTQLDDDGDGVNNALDQCPATPAGEAVDANGCSATQLDDDNDGIAPAIDRNFATGADERLIFSNDFSDVGLGGATTGTVVSRGEQVLRIIEEPGAGVRITADPAGGATPATVSVCGGSSIVTLSPGDEVVVTCSSVEIKVISGTVEIEFVAADGTPATTSLDAGNSLVFDPTTFTITAPSTNSYDVVVVVEGEEFSLAPGESKTFVIEANALKESAIGSLSALLSTGDNKTDKRIEKAIENIEKSLAQDFWEDDIHLTKKGKKVFDNEKKAVKHLQKLIKDKKVPDYVKDVCKEMIDKLVTADKLLAETALNDAKEYEGTDKKIDKEIEKSEKELEKATKELEKGKPDKAIDHFKKAWKHAFGKP